MRECLGEEAPGAMFAWWVDLMATANPHVLEWLFAHVATIDLASQLSQITAPTLMITDAGSVLAGTNGPMRVPTADFASSRERRTVWQPRMPPSALRRH